MFRTESHTHRLTSPSSIPRARAVLRFFLWACALLAPFTGAAGAADAEDSALRVLFLGDEGLHRPRQRFEILAPALADRGIELDYT